MTVGDHPAEPKRPRSYDLVYEVTDRARAMAPTIAGLLRAVVFLVMVPGFFFAISALFPIIGTALIASGASGFGLFVLIAVVVIALVIEILFTVRLRQYSRAVKNPHFVAEVAQLIDIADMSDEFLGRLRGAAERGIGWRRLRALWELWRTPNYFSDRTESLKLVRQFVPPRVNFNIRLAIAQFWLTIIMWCVLIIAFIARMSGAI